ALSATRRGVFLPIAALCLAVIMTFVAFSVDMGVISLTKTRMQNATDTAALAAAMEITHAISNAGPDVGNVFTYAQQQASAMAIDVADLNGVYVDSGDVAFGRRTLNSQTGSYEFVWNPAGDQVNCVKVVARRDNPDETAPDGQIPGLFTGLFQEGGTSVTAESIAYIEPRDMVVVHDFSRSMNFDSYYTDEVSTRLDTATIEENLQTVYDDLQAPNLGDLPYEPEYAWESKSYSGASATVTYKGDSVSVTTNTALKRIKICTGSYSGRRIDEVDVRVNRVGSTSYTWDLNGFEYDANTVVDCFDLDDYPYDGGSWSDFVDYVQDEDVLDDYGVRDKFGGKTFVCYLMRRQPAYEDCKDLWKTRHYPFHAIKEGHEILCDFLSDLGFDDYLGMVSYDSYHRIETTLDSSNPDIPYVDISSSPLTNDYDAVNKLMKYKQAAHYYSATNMSGGLKDGIELLDDHKRDGSRPAILLMTDGNSNTLDSGENGSLPGDWDWDELLDYDGDGSADYTTSSSQRKAVLKYVKEAVDKGYTVHAISVGNDADRDLLEAVAYLGNGYWVDVPGGLSAIDMEEELKEAFVKIASAVPPARLVKPSE
ncbi:MAG: hypothetical protein B7Z55_05590, partial [Planctomycetales bacterium 12-60-4]